MNVKGILAGIVAFLSALAYGLFQKARRETEKRKGIETARKVEQGATQDVIDGVKRTQEAANAEVDTSKRDHFERH